MTLIRRHADTFFSLLGGPYHLLTNQELWYAQNRRLADHWGAPPAGATLVDLGAGAGVGTLELARIAGPAVQVIGVDLTPSMIERAWRHHAAHAPELENVRFIVGDAARLRELPSSSVYAVVANSFLYLVPDPLAVLREARRVLEPGGRLVFMEPREEGSVAKALARSCAHAGLLAQRPLAVMRHVAAMVAWRVVSGVSGRMDEPTLRRLLGEAGFVDVSFHETLGGLGHHVVAARGGTSRD